MIATEQRARTEPAGTRPAWLGWLVPLALAAAPWSWFVVRDIGPSTNAVAFALPVVAVLAALVAVAWAILSTRMRFALVGVSLLALGTVVVVAPRMRQASPAPVNPFLLVAANTYDDNPTPDQAVRALVARHPDVLVAVEERSSLATGLADAYPEHEDAGRLSVYSIWRVRRLGRIADISKGAAIRVEVMRPDAPFVVYAIHLPNPLHEISFPRHAAMVDRLLEAAQAERLPVVVAGDFNMTDRSTSYRTLDAAFRDAMRASGFAGSTYDNGPWALLQLRIDHVFVSRDLCATSPATFGVPGSDHDAVSVALGACP